jgi:hypothetical protein
MSVVTSVSTVGSKKVPPTATLAPFLTASALLDRLHVDERADHRTRLEPVGDLHRPGSLGEPLGEGVDVIAFCPQLTDFGRLREFPRIGSPLPLG